MEESKVKERIDLAKTLDEVLEQEFQAKARQVTEKVRHVLDGVNLSRLKMLKAEKDFMKAVETYNKGLDKLDQIRKGNWKILDEVKEGGEKTE